MGFSTGKPSISLEDVLRKVTEVDILSYYLNVSEIPTFINSPLREDKRPSFGLYSSDGKRIYYTDLSTGDRGGLFDLLGKMWNKKYVDVLYRIYEDIPKMHLSANVVGYKPCKISTASVYNNTTDIQVKVREWRGYDLEYWESYGITKEWLIMAEVYPVSHIFIIKNGKTNCYPADKYAYAYVERKEGRVTLKVYQPTRSNDKGKWINKHDGSVISLWTKVPQRGNDLCICSSLKDALCLWCNTGIPAIAVQGEGYTISETAIRNLKQRFKNIFILYDNDEAGLADGLKTSESTGFTNIVLPQFEGGKDVSDLFLHLQDKQEFSKIIKSLFKH